MREKYASFPYCSATGRTPVWPRIWEGDEASMQTVIWHWRGPSLGIYIHPSIYPSNSMKTVCEIIEIHYTLKMAKWPEQFWLISVVFIASWNLRNFEEVFEIYLWQLQRWIYGWMDGWKGEGRLNVGWIEEKERNKGGKKEGRENEWWIDGWMDKFASDLPMYFPALFSHFALQQLLRCNTSSLRLMFLSYFTLHY